MATSSRRLPRWPTRWTRSLMWCVDVGHLSNLRHCLIGCFLIETPVVFGTLFWNLYMVFWQGRHRLGFCGSCCWISWIQSGIHGRFDHCLRFNVDRCTQGLSNCASIFRVWSQAAEKWGYESSSCPRLIASFYCPDVVCHTRVSSTIFYPKLKDPTIAFGDVGYRAERLRERSWKRRECRLRTQSPVDIMDCMEVRFHEHFMNISSFSELQSLELVVFPLRLGWPEAKKAWRLRWSFTKRHPKWHPLWATWLPWLCQIRPESRGLAKSTKHIGKT